MVNNCFVVGRKNYVEEKQGITFYRFPIASKAKCAKWNHLDIDYVGILSPLQEFVENISCLVSTKGTLLAFAFNFHC